MKRINLNNINNCVDLLYIYLYSDKPLKVQSCRSFSFAYKIWWHIFFFRTTPTHPFPLQLKDARLLHEYDSSTLYCWVGHIKTSRCQWSSLSTGRWFSPGTPISSTNKTDLHDITEILLKVALNTITITSITHHITVLYHALKNCKHQFYLKYIELIILYWCQPDR